MLKSVTKVVFCFSFRDGSCDVHNCGFSVKFETSTFVLKKIQLKKINIRGRSTSVKFVRGSKNQVH